MSRHRAGGGSQAGGAPAGHPRQEHGHHAAVQVGLKGLCHNIELEEAHELGELQQAILDKSTATTLQFRSDVLKGLCHDIELEEAHEPGELQQAILDKSTAPTLQFR